MPNDSKGKSAKLTISRDFVVSKCDYFVNVQLWPLKSQIDPIRWLHNFLPEEMEHAVYLLNSFVYFSESLVRQMFVATVQQLSSRVGAFGTPIRRAKTAWATFLDSITVTKVSGERPNDSDSGFIFARMARQVEIVRQNQICPPEETMSILLSKRAGRVLFVDDFVGTGNQFCETWKREYSINGTTMSFQRLSNALGTIEFFYCPLLCTEYGLERIHKLCPDIQVVPGHLVPTRYSAVHEDSVIWPSHLSKTAPDFLRNASLRAGIPSDKWKGFNDLGLNNCVFALCA